MLIIGTSATFLAPKFRARITQSAFLKASIITPNYSQKDGYCTRGPSAAETTPHRTITYMQHESAKPANLAPTTGTTTKTRTTKNVHNSPKHRQTASTTYHSAEYVDLETKRDNGSAPTTFPYARSDAQLVKQPRVPTYTTVWSKFPPCN